jgi:hypothetical protein
VTLKVLRWEERDKRFIIKEAQMATVTKSLRNLPEN